MMEDRKGFDQHRGCIWRRMGDRKGSVSVEFGLMFPIFLLLVFGMVDLSRAFYTAHDLSASVREGGRFAAALDDPTGRAPEIRAVVKDFAMNFAGEAVTDAQIEVNFDGESVTVRIRDYPFQFILLPFGQIDLTRQATLRWERAPLP